MFSLFHLKAKNEEKLQKQIFKSKTVFVIFERKKILNKFQFWIFFFTSLLWCKKKVFANKKKLSSLRFFENENFDAHALSVHEAKFADFF